MFGLVLIALGAIVDPRVVIGGVLFLFVALTHFLYERLKQK